MQHATFRIHQSIIGKLKASNIYAALLLGVFLVSSMASTLVVLLQPAGASIASPNVSAGDVYSAGDNTFGQVGVGYGQFHSSASEFQLPEGLTVVQSIQTAMNTYVLASDNQVYSAGGNIGGELGVGDRSLRDTPTQALLPSGVNALEIFAYARDSVEKDLENLYILADDGNVYVTGSNGFSMLGNGQGMDYVADIPEPFLLPGGVSAVDVSVHYQAVYVLGDDGNVYGAGENSYGELGNGTTTATSTPVVFPLPGGKTVAKFGQYIYQYLNAVSVITTDGLVYSAGDNYYGNFGDGTTASQQPIPLEFALPGGVLAEEVFLGYGFNSVLGDDGNVYSAGDNWGGMFGNGTTNSPQATPIVFQLPGGISAVDVHTPVYGSWMLVEGDNGQLYGAGYHDGALGTGSTGTEATPLQWSLPGGVSAVDVITDYTMAMVLADDGNVYVSGSNSLGELGTGNTSPVLTPVRYDTPLGLTVTAIGATVRDSLFTIHAVADGRVFGSGLNADSGALGAGILTNTNQVEEMALPGGVLASTIDAYRDNRSASTCAVTTLGRMYCAGRNMYGQLGDGGETTFVLTPQKFQLPAGVHGVKSWQVHGATQFVLGDDGQLYGAGEPGPIGAGSIGYVYDPVRVPLPPGVTVVDATPVGWQSGGNGRSMIVLGSDGVVYGSGNNANGILGNASNTATSSLVTYQLPVGVNASEIIKHENTDFIPFGVLGDDGNFYLAGQNFYGQLGNGSTSFSPIAPVAFPLPGGVTAVKYVSSGQANHVLGSDGNVYSAGQNNYGQLGNNNLGTNSSTPVLYQLPGGVTAVDITANWQEVYVLGSDGKIYGAGQNEYGQLGDGTNTPRGLPVEFQLPVGVTVSSFDQVNTPETRSISIVADDGNLYSAGINTMTDYWGNQAAYLGTPTPTAYEATPVRYGLPVGVTVDKLVTNRHSLIRVVLGSDGNVYTSGTNDTGYFGDGTRIGSSLPVAIPLPGAEVAVDVWADRGQIFIKSATDKLYGVGCNSIQSNCGGALATGDSTDVLTAAEIVFPSGVTVNAVEGNNYGTFAFITNSTHAVGSQLFCDANANTVFDSGDTYLNSGIIDLYAASGGVAMGPVLASYESANYVSDEGTFFFDGLPAGEYILGATINGTTTIYSTAFTLDGSGDGWILGSNPLIASGPLFAVTGSDCTDIISVLGGGGDPGSSGGGTTMPPGGGDGGDGTPETPYGTPDSDDPLQETGEGIAGLIAGASAFLVAGTALVLRKKSV